MENKYLVNALMVVGTVIITGALTWLVTRVDEGGTALEDAHIKAVVEEVIEKALILPDGTTLGAAVLDIQRTQANILGKLEILTE